MKKIIIFTCVFFSSIITVFSQQFGDINDFGTTLSNTNDIIWHQPLEGNSGMICMINNTPSGIFDAVNFILTEETNIKSITTSGVNPDGSLSNTLTGFSMYIYNNNNGKPVSDPSHPATGILEIINLSPTDPALTIENPVGGVYNFRMNVTLANGGDFILSPGNYWLSVAPHLNIDGLNEYARWYWSEGTQPTNSANAHLIDVDDHIGLGYTTWTSFPLVPLGAEFKGLAFTIEGMPMLSINNHILTQLKLTPNPADDFVSLSIPPQVKIEGVEIYNMLGAEIETRVINNQIDVSTLQSGVYIMLIETSAGSISKKLVIK